MAAKHGVATPPSKIGSQEAGESFVLCCGVLFVRSPLFFELHFRRRAKLQQEWSDSNEPLSSPRQLCEWRDAPGRKRARWLLQSSHARVEKPCAHLLQNLSSAGTRGWRQLWPFLRSGPKDVPLHTTPAAVSPHMPGVLTAESSYPDASCSFCCALTQVPSLGRKRSRVWSVLALMLL